MKYSQGKYENFNKIGFLFSRFLRLTPQLAIFMLLTTLILIFGSGPVWKQEVLTQVNNCYYNWWQNLLYLQTYLNVDNMV
jgi:peptidoglycan/LPS O-acetylase OafA/YrhL